MRIVAACLVFVFCWIYTSETGLYAGNGDTFSYLYAAQTFAEGKGFLNYDFGGDAFAQSIVGAPNGPMATFPPLYPFLLSLFGGGLHAARILNAIGLFASLLLNWSLMRIYGVPFVVRVGVCVAYVFFINDWTHLYTSAMSETVFIPAFLAWVIVMGRIQDVRSVLLLSGIASAMALSRYIGIPFILIGTAWVVYRRGWGMGAVSLVIPAFTVGAWCVRNYILVGKFTGHNLPGLYSWLEIHRLAMVLGYWALLATVCIGGALLMGLILERLHGTVEETRLTQYRLPREMLMAIVLMYGGIVFGSGFLTLINPPTERLYAPIAVPMVIVAWQMAQRGRVRRVIEAPLVRWKQRVTT